MPYFAKFTERGQRALQAAQREAAQLGRAYVGTEHLLLGVLTDPGAARDVLGGITLEAARNEIIQILGRGEDDAPVKVMVYTPRTKKVLEQSVREAQELKQKYVGVEHLLLALMREREGVAAHVLIKMGLDLNKARESLLRMIGGGQESPAPAEGTPRENETPTLDQFARDLTQAARGEIQCVGATTLNEYHKHIEKDSALERRFQPVNVGEPTREESVEILMGLRDRYEAHHRVQITDDAIRAAVNLSDRYISDRFLPDKAIDLIDEAASRVRIKAFTAPPDMKEQEAKLEALNKETEEAVAHEDFEKAARLRDEKKQLNNEMTERRRDWEQRRNAKIEIVGQDEVAQIVSAWTGIPVTRMTEDEAARLVNLEEILHARVVGQEEAVKAVSRAVRRARAGLKDPNRPIGSFIFLGPTGVGKTELCKALGEALFGDEDSLIRIDMSEYMEKYSVSRLIGSPPGYVGYEEGGQLTEKVRRKPYAVILLDEVEKAHPDVFNILLQILEDGRLTDGQGRVVDFKNTVIVMTSNAGAHELKRQRSLGFGSAENTEKAYDTMRENIMEEVKRTFRPEFLNRVDEIIVFHALEQPEIDQIARLMMRSVEKRLAERGIRLTVDEDALKLISAAGYDLQYGARPLRRAIQRMVEDALSEEILMGHICLGDEVRGVNRDGELKFEPVRQQETAPV